MVVVLRGVAAVLASSSRRAAVALLKNCALNRLKQFSTLRLPRPLRTMKIDIDTPTWQATLTPEVRQLQEIFQKNNYEIRLAGGAVRDILMHINPHDLDFATTATPQQMQEMFTREFIRMISYGERAAQHGTVTVRLNDKVNYEVTTLRIDRKTDGRHAEVEFTTDWQLDASRRDLTINSMFLGLDGVLYDYFGGYEDLQARRVLFVGDAADRIKEDYLRILRYFRFYGRICENSESHDASTLQIIAENAGGLSGVSGERIWVELKKIITGKYGDKLVKSMVDVGIKEVIGLPGDANANELVAVYARSASMKPDAATLAAALFVNENQVATFTQRLRLSKEELGTILLVVAHRDRFAAAGLGRTDSCGGSNGGSSDVDDGDSFTSEARLQFCQDIVVDSGNESHKCKSRALELLKYLGDGTALRHLAAWTVPRFPLSGQHLVALNVPRGPQMARVMNALREMWKASRFELTESQLLDEAKVMVADGKSVESPTAAPRRTQV